MNLRELEKKYQRGVTLIRKRMYYDVLISEVQIILKYINDRFFINLLSENIFNDIKGVFGTFVKQDLKNIYEEMSANPNLPLKAFFQTQYTNLEVLRKCSTNLNYQVKSLVRMQELKNLEIRSSFLHAMSRKLNGEIHELYKELSNSYKQNFPFHFFPNNNNNDRVTLKCIEYLSNNFDEHFMRILNRFNALSDAIDFVRDLFRMELEKEIHDRIYYIFIEKQEKLNILIDYFIDDLKKDFLRTLQMQINKGHNYSWIQQGFLKFIASPRFEMMLRRVINQTFMIIRKNNPSRQIQDIF